MTIEMENIKLEVASWIESYLSSRAIPLHKKVIGLGLLAPEGQNPAIHLICLTSFIACIRTVMKDKEIDGLMLEVKDLLATDFDSITAEAVDLYTVLLSRTS